VTFGDLHVHAGVRELRLHVGLRFGLQQHAAFFGRDSLPLVRFDLLG
jgi:hypothetical protein